jgi:hypothetical protein
MSRSKLFLLSLLALCALSTGFSASADATPEWWVAGGVIKTAEKLTTKVEVPEPIVFQSGAITIECSKLEVTGGFVRPKNENSAESLVFSECKVPGDATCVVETIKTKALKFPLAGTAGAISLNFAPTTENVIATFKITSCTNKATSGEKVIKSNSKTGIGMKCDYPGVESEQLNHELEFSAKSGSELEIESEPKGEAKSEPLSLLALVKWALASAKKWSARAF